MFRYITKKSIKKYKNLLLFIILFLYYKQSSRETYILYFIIIIIIMTHTLSLNSIAQRNADRTLYIVDLENKKIEITDNTYQKTQEMWSTRGSEELCEELIKIDTDTQE